MAASEVTVQSIWTPWVRVRTIASEVHSQQSLMRAARHDPCAERTRISPSSRSRRHPSLSLRPTGELRGHAEPAAHLDAAQLRAASSLFPRLDESRCLASEARRRADREGSRRGLIGVDASANRGCARRGSRPRPDGASRSSRGLLRGANERLGSHCADWGRSQAPGPAGTRSGRLTCEDEAAGGGCGERRRVLRGLGSVQRWDRKVGSPVRLAQVPKDLRKSGFETL